MPSTLKLRYKVLLIQTQMASWVSLIWVLVYVRNVFLVRELLYFRYFSSPLSYPVISHCSLHNNTHRVQLEHRRVLFRNKSKDFFQCCWVLPPWPNLFCRSSTSRLLSEPQFPLTSHTRFPDTSKILQHWSFEFWIEL